MLDHVSYSQIGMWNRCPKSWYYRYVEGLKVAPAGAMIEGSCYHKALETNFKQKITTMEDLPVDHCADAFSDAWEERLREEERIEWEDKDPGELKDEGIWLVRTYIKEAAPDIQPAEVEQVYVKKISGVKTVGVIDLVDTTKHIIDHKTAAKKYTQSDVDKDDQITTYAFMKSSGALAQVHVAVKPTKTLPPRIQILKTYRTLEDIKWWLEMVEGIIAQMQSGIAPPRSNGWWCSPRFCGYFSRCRGESARFYSIQEKPIVHSKKKNIDKPDQGALSKWLKARRTT